MNRVFAAFFAFLFLTTVAAAQQPVWVQIEAQPSVSQAQARAEVYDRRLDNVAGFDVGRNWFAIVLGPYERSDAETVLRQLRREGQIPGDSFIATGRTFGNQFWPIGRSAETTAQPLSEGANDRVIEETVLEEPIVEPVQIPDETLRQARDSEVLLDREQKKDLQIALQWAGFYSGTIDGLYGRGTRSSMRAWQEANNHEPTGVLTTRQRAELIAAYNSVLDGMDLQVVRDGATGIQMQIPTGVVAFTEYEAPFARFDATGDVPAQVLLVSQEGDQNRLFGLYEILQTLEIMPQTGPRERRDASFTMEGIGDGKHSYASVSLQDDEIKGFILVWPQDDDERRRRVLDLMIESYVPIDGTLDPALARPGEEQSIDLVSGLAIRKPEFSLSGFYVNTTGAVLTSSRFVGSCDYLTINTDSVAKVTYSNEDLGIAIIEAEQELAPLSIAEFQTSVPRIQSDIAVAGYPFGGILTAPSLTFGKLADIRGLSGEEELKRLSLTAQEGDAGGPIYDNGGAVLGMLLPKANDTQQILPEDVSFSLDADVIVAALSEANVDVQTTNSLAFMAPETLTRRAADQTVLVSCW